MYHIVKEVNNMKVYVAGTKEMARNCLDHGGCNFSCGTY